ncbi:hypothetical protein LK994_05340 [Ferruginibacter lapsinanis]|uniref:hypothetical protein n=1 Tax=Ferruginibacter lapsinanis TaxID=563172 RepID=UPI001E4411BB|nr:hypothetical protein [Ferruginibacter lapsinanis]UEG50896.1 hypothetical protein LK994_05340 [Ferruginibacter lapsinanis]
MLIDFDACAEAKVCLIRGHKKIVTLLHNDFLDNEIIILDDIAGIIYSDISWLFLLSVLKRALLSLLFISTVAIYYNTKM